MSSRWIKSKVSGLTCLKIKEKEKIIMKILLVKKIRVMIKGKRMVSSFYWNLSPLIMRTNPFRSFGLKGNSSISSRLVQAKTLMTQAHSQWSLNLQLHYHYNKHIFLPKVVWLMTLTIVVACICYDHELHLPLHSYSN